LYCVLPDLTEPGRAPCRTFDCERLDIAEPSTANLDGELLGAMKVGGREVCRAVRWIANSLKFDVSGKRGKSRSKNSA
jgi:hypothetical protein